ncbi:MAG: cytochrome P450 [Aggregatilineales bacterium]
MNATGASALFSPELARQRYSLYTAMRTMQPIMPLPEYDLWLAFRYQDVRTILSDYESFSSRVLGGGATISESEAEAIAQATGLDSSFRKSLIASDPPLHRKLRDLLSKAFTPRAIEKLEPRIVELTTQMLDKVIANGKMDVVHDLAYPLPVIVIAEMLGIPPEDRAAFKAWSDDLVSNSNEFIAGVPSDESQTANRYDSYGQMSSYLIRTLNLRRVEPRDDLISALLAAEVDGQKLTQNDLLSFCVLLLIAGNITTTNLITNAVIAFTENPGAYRQLQASPELLPSTVEEVLRYYSPVQAMARLTRREVELGGQTIPAGQRVVAWIGSANRDETIFSDADRFDIARQPNPHVAFGYGVHYCLGAPLARLEGKIALSAISQRLHDLQRADDAPLDFTPGMLLNGVTHLPVRFTPQPKS